MSTEGLITTITYKDDYGYLWVNKGYALELILNRVYTPKFPHYKPIEREIALTFIARYKIPGYYYFDFRFPAKMPEEVLRAPEPFRRMWMQLSAYRCDLIIDTVGYYLVCEIKDLLSSTAISQPLLYTDLFRKYVKPAKDTRPTLIVGEAKYEALDLARRLGIECFVLNIPSQRKRILGV